MTTLENVLIELFEEEREISGKVLRKKLLKQGWTRHQLDYRLELLKKSNKVVAKCDTKDMRSVIYVWQSNT